MSLESNPGRHRKYAWGLKDEEYTADFCLVSRRNLDDREYEIFKYHFLLGADWKLCCQKLGTDRGSFFHDVYRIEETMGRIFRELEPHALFPLDEYFNSTGRAQVITSSLFRVETEDAPKAIPIPKFPVKRAA